VRRVILESPFAGATRTNLNYARLALRDSLDRGEAPFASHLIYPLALEESILAERDKGIAAGFVWGEVAEAVVFYMDLGFSPGMRAAHVHYSARGILIENRSILP